MSRFSTHHTEEPLHSYRNDFFERNGTGISVPSLERTELAGKWALNDCVPCSQYKLLGHSATLLEPKVLFHRDNWGNTTDIITTQPGTQGGGVQGA